MYDTNEPPENEYTWADEVNAAYKIHCAETGDDCLSKGEFERKMLSDLEQYFIDGDEDVAREWLA